jgi:hypothetical protein
VDLDAVVESSEAEAVSGHDLYTISCTTDRPLCDTRVLIVRVGGKTGSPEGMVRKASNSSNILALNWPLSPPVTR